ncbi:PREDICTED: bromodomain adjacent to zinc finger domain protein 2A, partial [Corvus brachyrhynchos]|uniref:bromodomain adjacent to zinc finger domain protein 2A n=1 Tax=Corvus brachyrhynchos TaxID=85066 RepID=UPI0008163DF7
METNNHFNFTGLSSAPAASGPKPTPASGDSPFTHSSPLSFPLQGKSLNGGMNVNGFSTVSHPGTSGTFSPGSAPAGAQPLRAYACLWDYAPSPPGHGTNLRAAGQEFWGNGTAGPMGLNFDSQELYDSFHDQSFELMQNGPDGFYAAGQSSPILSSDTQPFPLAPDEPDPGQGDADGAAKEMSTTIAENGGGLVGSQELEEAQPDLKICSYNQSPEVIKYLSRNMVQDVRREHFSFSPRMPVGDFYEERDTPEGVQWVKLSPEEIPGRIQAITGKRGRPRNAEKAKPKEPPAAKRGRGRPPKVRMVDLLSKTDARLLKRLEAQEVLSDEDKLKMSKIKKKMRRKAKNKQKQEAKAPRAKEAKKKSKAKERKGKQEKGKDKARPKEKKGKGARKADKGLLGQRRLGERRGEPPPGKPPWGQGGDSPNLSLCSAQSLKILGEKVSEISLNRDTVSEVLRCFLTAHGAGTELCEGLRTKPFQALPPERKAAILVFLVNELNSSALIISEIDKTLENMSNYRKNKWIIEGRLRRLKVALAKKTGRPESEITGLEDGRRRRSSRLTEDAGLEMEEEEETRGRKSRREEEADTSASSVPELERQIEKLAKRQMFFRKKLLHSSQTLRAASLGQDRFRRRYWVLPHLGGIFVEGAEAAEAVAQEPPEEKVSPHMQSGWWWLRDPEELEAVARALHPRGIREKALHKHLTKHKEFLREGCLRSTTDPIFPPRPESATAAVSQEALAQWSVPDRAYETDLGVLQWVEELEQRVLMADLQIRGWTCPSPDSTRDDLRYCEHKVEPLEDITPEELSLGPTEIAYEITPRVRTWRHTLERCRSAAQVSLCIFQLEKSIAWEKSVNRVVRAWDGDGGRWNPTEPHRAPNLLQPHSAPCHLYCHRPRMTEVPEGDWFCSVCVARAGQYRDPISPRRGKKRKR